jgi:hypothetical protein
MRVANKKYYAKEENQEKKRAYAREYARRPEVIAKRKAHYYSVEGQIYYKNYYKNTDVKKKMKKYARIYNARPKVKIARHEWYLKQLVDENEKSRSSPRE